MNAETQRVDAIEMCLQHAANKGLCPKTAVTTYTERRDAVAELIEADKAFDCAKKDYDTTAPSHRGKKWPAVVAAAERRAVALSRLEVRHG